jgi:hypothetical protein
MRLAALLVILTGVGSAGCETFGKQPCDTSAQGNPTVTYTGGTTADGVYMSSSWSGPLLYWPGGQHYALVHGLGVTPSWIQAYVSFDEGGVGGTDGGLDGGADAGVSGGGTLAPAAGNDAEIGGVDGTSIQIANDTCASYWLLVVAGTGPGPAGAAP